MDKLSPREKQREFEHNGMKLISWKTELWWEVDIYMPGRKERIGMTREHMKFYSLEHVENRAKNMASRILPKLTSPKLMK